MGVLPVLRPPAQMREVELSDVFASRAKTVAVLLVHLSFVSAV